MKYFIFISLLFFSSRITAQRTKEVQNQHHFWWSINSTVKVYKQWSVVGDLHIRRTDFLKNNNFYYTRIGAAYAINQHLSVSVGGGHMWLANKTATTELFVNENRLVEQIQLTQSVGKVQLSHRLRLEQRWIQKIVNNELSDEYRYSTRYRYQLSLNIPVSSNPYVPAIALSDELMLQTGKDIVYNYFDQNRLFAGMKQQITPSLSFDVGYMRVYQQRLSGYQYNRNHTVRLFFHWQPDFRKNKHRAAATPSVPLL